MDNQPQGTPKENILQFGGQAVLEGVMMRSAHYYAVACRKPNGEMLVHCEPVDTRLMRRLRFLRWPFARGTLALIDSMTMGARALQYASQVQLQTINGNSAGEKQRINDIAVGGTLLFALLFAIAVFKLLPTLITAFLHRMHWLGPHVGPHALNALDGIIRLVFFFAYILIISRMKAIYRVFQYHGAEHKAINTLEAGLPLTLENAQNASRIHPRCGTSFIFVVLILDLVSVALLPRPESILIRFLLQLAVVPVVAGIAYECIKLAGRYRNNLLVRAVFGPGMATQYLTTREPLPDMVETALAALQRVREAEASGEEFPPPAI